MEFLNNDSYGRLYYPEISNGTDNSTGNQYEILDDGDGSPANYELLYFVVYQNILPLLIALGLLTNSLNVFTLWKVRARQKLQKRHDMATTYNYLLWLAITDLMAILSLIPALIHLDRTDLTYAWAFYYAHFEIPIINAFTSASVYIVVGLSVDRFIAVCFPRRYLYVNAPRLAVFRITLSLIVPFILYIPHCFYQEVVYSPNGGWTYQGDGVLTESYAWYIWEIIVELCHRMIPATILAVLNICIIVTFRKVIAQNKARVKAKKILTEAKENDDDGGRRKREKRLVYLLVAVVCSFLITNLPAAVLALTDTAGAIQGSWHYEVFRAVANCLEILGFSLNFVLYFFFVNDIKEVLKELPKRVKTKLCCAANYVRNNHSAPCSERLTGISSKVTETVNL